MNSVDLGFKKLFIIEFFIRKIKQESEKVCSIRVFRNLKIFRNMSNGHCPLIQWTKFKSI